jgi:hypothetical protein
MNPIKIGPGGEFLFGGEKFVIEVDAPPKERRPSTSDAFTIVKTNRIFAFTKTSLPASHQDQFLNKGFFREEATCSWTSSSNLAECPQWIFVQSLWSRYCTTSRVTGIDLSTLAHHSKTVRC